MGTTLHPELAGFSTRTLLEEVFARLNLIVGKARLAVEAEEGRVNNVDHGQYRVGVNELSRYDPPGATR